MRYCIGGVIWLIALAQIHASEASNARQRIVLDDFEGVKPSWQIRKSQSLAGVTAHRRSDRGPREGRRCETISAYGTRGGEQILAVHPMPASAAIQELRIALWLRGNRTGFQLMARVRLPRALDDEGQPISFYVSGDTYSAADLWQELVLTKLDEKIENAVRAQRIALGKHIDPAEAYVDQVAVNIYGGAGLNRLWTDELTLESAVPVVVRPPNRQSVHLANYETPIVVGDGAPINRSTWVPRAVTHRGESFELLKQLGFNSIWLSQAATDRQLTEARTLGIWLICPPPLHHGSLGNFDRVAAWSIDERFQSSRQAMQTIRALRAADRAKRPVVSMADRDQQAQSNLIDIPVVKNRLASGSTKSNAAWIALGTPLVDASRWLPLRNQIWDGIIAGYGGFVLRTSDTLEGPQARHTRHLAELFNIELTMMLPWISQRQAERFTNRNETSRFSVTGLANRHASIAFVRRRAQADRIGLGWNEIEIPTSSHRDVFRVEPGGISPVAYRQVAGGIRVALNPSKPDGILLLTDRTAIIEAIARYLSEIGPRSNDLLVEVLRVELLELDRRLQHAVDDPTLRGHWRKEVHALHDRIAPILDRHSGQSVSFRELDHVMGQLERVDQMIRE